MFIIFHCRYLHPYLYTYYSVPLVPYCKHLFRLDTGKNFIIYHCTHCVYCLCNTSLKKIKKSIINSIIIIIIMFTKDQACFLFLDPQDEVGPSISSSVVPCCFVFLVYTVALVLVFSFCPFSVRVVVTFGGIVSFPLLCYVLLFFSLMHRIFYLTLRLLMSYIYIYMERIFLMFLDHTQRRTTVGRTPLDERSARRRDLYLTTHDPHNRQISMPTGGMDIYLL